jgi:uncharacterized protein with NRDE domain
MSWHQENTTEPPILSGVDLQEGGTWLALNASGRIAAVTNVRDPQYFVRDESLLSRGELPTAWVNGALSPAEMNAKLNEKGILYSGYNFLYGSLNDLHFHSNHNLNESVQPTGVHGLSNASIDTPWPKVVHGKAALEEIAKNSSSVEEIMEKGLALMSSETIAPDSELPSTGVPLEVERELSALNVKRENYATRVTTIIVKDRNNKVWVLEHNHQTLNQEHFTFIQEG